MSVVPDKYRGKREFFLAFSELLNAARHRGTTSYQELASIVGLPTQGAYMGSELAQLLGEISEDENNRGRPMLSAVAVSVDHLPGKGFFKLPRRLGKLQSNAAEDELAFWRAEKEDVYDTRRKEYKIEPRSPKSA